MGILSDGHSAMSRMNIENVVSDRRLHWVWDDKEIEVALAFAIGGGWADSQSVLKSLVPFDSVLHFLPDNRNSSLEVR